MKSLILRASSGFLSGMLVLLSIVILIRGHNEPGGGFIGGLVAASGLALYALAHGPAEGRRKLRFDPRGVLATGLLVSILSGCVAVFAGRTFLTGLWMKTPVPLVGKLSTVLAFDIGVYLVVLGTALLILFTLDEEN
jgi:multicomponent Na+:H+ antiporter subunit B